MCQWDDKRQHAAAKRGSLWGVRGATLGELVGGGPLVLRCCGVGAAFVVVVGVVGLSCAREPLCNDTHLTGGRVSRTCQRLAHCRAD